MLQKHISIIIIALTVVVLALSCTGYEKVVKSDDANLKYTKAFYYYNRGDYVKAGTLFDQLAPMVRGTRRADSVFYFQAMTQYKLSDYIIAGHYFQNFVDMYGNSPLVEEAAYMG